MHTYPDAQSVDVLHCCWQAPATHMYGAQLCSDPFDVITVNGSLHVPVLTAHVPFATSQRLPVEQSASLAHDDLQSPLPMSQEYGRQAVGIASLHIPKPSHWRFTVLSPLH